MSDYQGKRPTGDERGGNWSGRDNRGGFKNRDDRGAGGFKGGEREGFRGQREGFRGRDDRGGERGGFRNDRDGGFRGREDRGGDRGGFRGRDDRGGFRNDREGGFRGDRADGGFRGRDDRGGYNRDDRGGFKRDDRGGDRGGFRNDRDGGFRGRDDRGGYNRDDRGGFKRDDRGGDRGGFRNDRDGGFRGRDDRGGFRGRDDRDGGFRGRDDRGGFNRDERGGFRGRDDRDGGFRGRDDRGGERGGDRGGFKREGRREGQGGFGRDDKGFSRDQSREQRGFGAGRGQDEGRGYAAGADRNSVDGMPVSGPPIPDNVTLADLDKDSRDHLRTLSKAGAEIVGRHLVMVSELIDIDPQLAYEHAQAALKRAARVDVVREACAVAAYATDQYQEALRELKTARRLSGQENLLLAVEADCERGVGQPTEALKIYEEASLEVLDLDEYTELSIVAAGAHTDLGQTEQALSILEKPIPGLDEDAELYSRFLEARVELLRVLGREEEALRVEANMPEMPEEELILDLVDLAAEDPEFDPSLAEKTHYLLESALPLAEQHDVVLLDLDGVCWKGSAPIENAAQGISAAATAGQKKMFVTNNASRTPAEVAEKLGGMGIDATAPEIMTASIDAAMTLQDELEEGAKVLAIGGNGVRVALQEAGFTVVTSADEQPAAVVQGYGPEVGWSELSEAAFAINAGATYIATNIDSTLPTERGMALGNGSLVAAVTHATGVKATPCGKPFAKIFHRAAAIAEAANPMTVGDRLNTDIAGGRAAKVPALHVLTGVNSAKDVVCAKAEQRPSYLGLDMLGLLQPQPAVDPEPQGWWQCNGVRARALETERGHAELELESIGALEEQTTVSLDEYRALAAAAWDAADSGMKIECPELIVQLEVLRESDDSDEQWPVDLSEEEAEDLAEDDVLEDDVIEETVSEEIALEEEPDGDNPAEAGAVGQENELEVLGETEE